VSYLIRDFWPVQLIALTIWFWYVKLVGSIEQTEDTDEAKPEKEADSTPDPKNGSKPMDVDKAKTKRKYFVGQELEFRRDHMEVSNCTF
jgi:actin-like protein 6A